MEIFGQFVRFAAVGVTGTAIQYVILWLGADILGLNAAACSGVGYIAGSVANYFLNYLVTFKSDKPHADAATKYFTVLGVGWCINTGAMWWLVQRFFWNHWVAQMVATAIGLAWNFIGSRFWAFNQKVVATLK
jgi:putative flippase GtrA